MTPLDLARVGHRPQGQRPLRAVIRHLPRDRRPGWAARLAAALWRVAVGVGR